MRAAVPSLQRQIEFARTDEQFIAAVMFWWDESCDTMEIAAKTFELEAVVATALRIGRERRRAAQ